MKTIDLETTDHDFKKVKSIFNPDGIKKYSIYECIKCKMKAKRLPFETIVYVSNDYDHNKIIHCITNMNEDIYVGREIQITQFNSKGELFANLQPGSIHVIVSPPLYTINGNCGIWVMGIGKCVKVLFEEFRYYKGHIKRTKH